jgi:hypothetical protein
MTSTNGNSTPPPPAELNDPRIAVRTKLTDTNKLAKNGIIHFLSLNILPE